MKKLSTTLLMLLLCLTTAVSVAQEKPVAKSRQFATSAAQVDISDAQLQKTFTAVTGEAILIELNGLKFSGTVISNTLKYSNLQTILIRDAGTPNTIFQLSKIIRKDQSIAYSGRIINSTAVDGYELKRSSSGYRLQKFDAGQILQDCAY
ncbi:MAG: hypothetical protein JWQ27_1063 [Ferruginibacter sp.]|nr:hypothetical protein [Ferruginibacter sp.]